LHKTHHYKHVTASMAEQITSLARVREVCNSNPGQSKFFTVLQTVHQRFNNCESSCVALSLARRWAFRKLVEYLGVTWWV